MSVCPNCDRVYDESEDSVCPYCGGGKKRRYDKIVYKKPNKKNNAK